MKKIKKEKEKNNILDIIKEHCNKKTYQIEFEIQGKQAMFARPDTGSSGQSYIIPPWSAAKGMIETIAGFMPTVFVIPYKVEICSPIVFNKYSFNYNGHLSDETNIINGNPQQIHFYVLENMCYRIYAYVVSANHKYIPEKYIHLLEKNSNPAHAYQDIFYRRLNSERNIYTACLGQKDFVADYVGRFRETTKVQEDINMVYESLLFSSFDKINFGRFGKEVALFIQNAKIEKGVHIYVK